MDRMETANRTGMVIGGITVILSFILFFAESKTIVGSLMAAVMAGGLAWLSYVVIRMIVFTFSK